MAVDVNALWEREAHPLKLLVDLHALIASAKVFSSGSRGWYASQKLLIGEEKVQVTFIATVIGSKPKPETEAAVQKASKAKKPHKTVSGTLADGSAIIPMPPS